MLRRRPEILAERQHLAADFAQIVHRLEKFRLRFAEAEHDAAFCHDLGRKLLRAAQDLRARCDIWRANEPRA